jgi:hypothetical protein
LVLVIVIENLTQISIEIGQQAGISVLFVNCGNDRVVAGDPDFQVVF